MFGWFKRFKKGLAQIGSALSWGLGKDPHRVLVFPAGTIVKFNGVPCLLLRDSPYESETFKDA